MATNKKRALSFLLCLLASIFTLGILFPIRTMAQESSLTSTEPSVMIVAEYDEGIEAAEGDRFEITFVNDDTGVSDTITILAMDVVNYAIQEIEEGTYTVTDIEYLGNNDVIIEEGYGTVSFFSSDTEGGSILRISVGETAVQRLISTDYYAVVKDGMHEEDGTWKSGEDLAEMGVVEDREPESDSTEAEESSESSESSNAADGSSYGNNDSENTDGASSEDAEIVYFDEESGSNSEAMSVVRSLVFLGVVLVVGVLILWMIGKKKNK